MTDRFCSSVNHEAVFYSMIPLITKILILYFKKHRYVITHSEVPIHGDGRGPKTRYSKCKCGRVPNGMLRRASD